MCMSTSELCTLTLYSMEAELQGQQSANRDNQDRSSAPHSKSIFLSFFPSLFLSPHLANSAADKYVFRMSKARGDKSQPSTPQAYSQAV